MNRPFDIVILGLSVTSSWGNGHATTYRSLIRGLATRRHRVLFLERETPWYSANRDDAQPFGAETVLYDSFEQLVARYEGEVRRAGLVIVGSFVPDGARVGDWVTSVAKGITAFYDIDTPVTLANLAEGCRKYLTPELVRRYRLYLSFTGGPVLTYLETHYGAPLARQLYCSVDPRQYRPLRRSARWDLGYLGTYSDDRQPPLESLMLGPAKHWASGRFIVVGPLYPEHIRWPKNVERNDHLAPPEHPAFYASQRFTLNLTRAAMKKMGYSPSVRLFEAGACGVPIISDLWDGLEELFVPGREVLVARSGEDTLRFLRNYPESRRQALGHAARLRILAEHTPEQRAAQLEGYLKEVHDNTSPHTSRRNGRGRHLVDGLEARVASEPQGPVAGGETRSKAGAAAPRRRVHEPAGAGRRDR